MSTQLRLAGPGSGAHPALVSRRLHDLAVTGVAGAVALVVALGVTTAVPNPNPALIVGLIACTLGVIALMISTRYELTLTLVVLYLGLLDGPVKLLSDSQAASAIRNVLIFAIVIGMVVRLSVSRERIKMPPLSGWVVAFVAVVLVEALNPSTGGPLKILGGFRQQLEWVPFFFFGYMIMRSKANFRKLFLLLGVIALANGLVGAYQSGLSPAGLGSWGPGYNARLNGTGGLSGRTYSAEGVSKPRPPALGSDSGFGGGIGVVALPGLLALLSVGRVRRRWVAALLCAGALLGIATAASRTSVVIAVVALLSYALLAVMAGLRVSRPLAGLVVVVALAVGVGSVLVSANGKGIFARQETITSVSQAESSGGAAKAEHLEQIPRDIAGSPLGAGLGTGGSAGGFGGSQKVEIEGKGASAEGAYNLLVIETGVPGLLLWVGLSIEVLLLAVRRLRRVADLELRTYLVAAFAAYAALTVAGFAGPTLAVAPEGTYLWFAAGVAAYWFVGPGRAASDPTIASAAT